MFFPDSPTCCASPSRSLYKSRQDRTAGRHLAAQFFRLYGSRPVAPAFRSSLYGSVFGFQFAARVQAPLQMSASMWCVPAAALGRKVMVTGVLPSPLPARQEQMVKGSVAEPSYEVLDPFAPREYNTDVEMGSVAGTLASAGIANAEDEQPSKLRLRLAGTAPGVGESHFVFPPDCLGGSRRDDASDMRRARKGPRRVGGGMGKL